MQSQLDCEIPEAQNRKETEIRNLRVSAIWVHRILYVVINNFEEEKKSEKFDQMSKYILPIKSFLIHIL